MHAPVEVNPIIKYNPTLALYMTMHLPMFMQAHTSNQTLPLQDLIFPPQIQHR